MRQLLTALVFQNDKNWHYANSVIQTLLWSACSRVSFTIQDLGKHSRNFLSMFMKDTKTVCLHTAPWFDTILTIGMLGTDSRMRQNFCNFSGVTRNRPGSTWLGKSVRKLTLPLRVWTRAHFQTLLFNFQPMPLPKASNSTFCLQDLAQLWHLEHNMVKALCQTREYWCLTAVDT